MKFLSTVVLFFSILSAAHAETLTGRSGCVLSDSFFQKLTCPHLELDVKGRYFTRTVKYGIPTGRAPKGGWPAVVIYQGTFFPVEFERREGYPFGGYNEIRLVQHLLDAGFVVIAPPAMEKIAWMTNLIGVDYESSEDFYFVQSLLQSIQGGDFGRINLDRLYATGISSGGYHTSRMAVSFPGVFRALAIQSGSYATCGGPLCVIPELPEKHPPTLFLHGRLDTVVPELTMWMYEERLGTSGVETSVFVDDFARHQWVERAPELITDWFLSHK